MQKPPVFSALKVKGQRMSDLARSGQEVEIIARPVTSYSINLLRYDPPDFEIGSGLGMC